MSAPGIELRWGYGFDQRPRRIDMARPFVKEAINFALEGMYELGMPVEDRRYLWVQEKDHRDKWKGGAKGKTCFVAIEPEEIRRQRIDTVWLAAFIVHELVHLEHEKYVPENGMLDVAASEGLAHIAQYEFANDLLYKNGRKGPPYRVVEKIRSLPKRETTKLEADFWKASAKPYTEERFNDWFSRLGHPLGFPRGATVGVSAVSRQLDAGWELAELIMLPPHEVLDVA